MIPEYLEVRPEPAPIGGATQAPLQGGTIAPEAPKPGRALHTRDWFLIAAAILITAGFVLFMLYRHNRQVKSQTLDLNGLGVSALQGSTNINEVTINGQLQATNGIVLKPSAQPNGGTAGLIYYDQSSNQIRYYNGTAFVSLGADNGAVNSVGGLQGNVGIGTGLQVAGTNLINTGVLSLMGQTGAVTLNAGNGIGINGTTY
jgi:hypothetical protein